MPKATATRPTSKDALETPLGEGTGCVEYIPNPQKSQGFCSGLDVPATAYLSRMSKDQRLPLRVVRKEGKQATVTLRRS